MKYQIVDVSGSEYDVYDTQEEASRELLEYRLAYASNHGGDEEAHMEVLGTYRTRVPYLHKDVQTPALDEGTLDFQLLQFQFRDPAATWIRT